VWLCDLVSFGVRFRFLSGFFFFFSPSSSLPLDNSTIPTRTIQKSKTQKKGFFLDAFTYAPLFTYYINQLYYIIHILLLFSLHRLLSLLDWEQILFCMMFFLLFIFSPSVAEFLDLGG